MKISLRKCILGAMSVHRYLDFVLILIVTLFNFKYVRIKLLLAIMAAGIVSVCTITYVGYPYDKFVQQFLLLSISIIGYDIFFRKYVRDVRDLFMLYMRFAKILTIVTFVQLVVYIITGRDIFFFTLTTSELIRVHAWLSEPGCYATFMTPAVAYVIYNKEYRKSNRISSWCILISYLLSLSAIAFFVLAIILFQWLYVRYKKVVNTVIAICILLVSTTMVSFSNKSNDTSEEYSFDTPMGAIIGKIKQSFTVLRFFEPMYFERMNASTYATMTNLWVAVNAPSRIIGTGLGTHEYNYTTIYKNRDYYLYGLNKDDGYSLFTRLFSEFGILGVLIASFTLYRFYNVHDPINRAILMYFVSMLVRGGLYTMYGMLLFSFIYYYTGRKSKIACKCEYISH